MAVSMQMLPPIILRLFFLYLALLRVVGSHSHLDMLRLDLPIVLHILVLDLLIM